MWPLRLDLNLDPMGHGLPSGREAFNKPGEGVVKESGRACTSTQGSKRWRQGHTLGIQRGKVESLVGQETREGSRFRAAFSIEPC